MLIKWEGSVFVVSRSTTATASRHRPGGTLSVQDSQIAEFHAHQHASVRLRTGGRHTRHSRMCTTLGDSQGKTLYDAVISAHVPFRVANSTQGGRSRRRWDRVVGGANGRRPFSVSLRSAHSQTGLIYRHTRSSNKTSITMVNSCGI